MKSAHSAIVKASGVVVQIPGESENRWIHLARFHRDGPGLLVDVLGITGIRFPNLVGKPRPHPMGFRVLVTERLVIDPLVLRRIEEMEQEAQRRYGILAHANKWGGHVMDASELLELRFPTYQEMELPHHLRKLLEPLANKFYAEYERMSQSGRFQLKH